MSLPVILQVKVGKDYWPFGPFRTKEEARKWGDMHYRDVERHAVYIIPVP